MSVSQSNDELKLTILNARSEIIKIVAFACRKYNHGAPPDEVEELTEQIILLLLEDNGRRLKTYDTTKAKFNTWLRPVIFHHALHYYQKQPPSQPIEDLSERQISKAALQEKELLTKEQRKLLHEAIAELSPHDQRIVYLKLEGATDQEIAQIMNVKVRSLQQEWSRIMKRLKEFRGGQTPCQIHSLKLFLRMRQHFVVLSL